MKLKIVCLPPLIWKSCLLTIYYLPACYLPTTIIYLRYSIKSLEWIKTWFYHFQYLFNGQGRIRKFAFSNCAWNKQHIEKFFFQFDSGPAPGFSNQKIVVSILLPPINEDFVLAGPIKSSTTDCSLEVLKPYRLD